MSVPHAAERLRAAVQGPQPPDVQPQPCAGHGRPDVEPRLLQLRAVGTDPQVTCAVSVCTKPGDCEGLCTAWGP